MPATKWLSSRAPLTFQWRFICSIMLFAFLTFLGSLGLFLYGMKVMSEGLQRSAGERLRRILNAMTRNRVSGLLTGFLTTSVIQSSSATTVMLVGFVNAGLVTLRQAIGVIMGANIGTTVTFWIVSFLGFKFSITALALPAVGAGMFLLMVRRLNSADAGSALLGFGLLFLGLDFLKDSVPDVQQHTDALAFLSEWQNGSFLHLLGFFAFGTLLTVVVQSSSAAGAVTLLLAYKGWIDFPSSCAIVLGENVGTTITANLAAIGANIHARRTARAHFVFNVIGVCWIFIVFIPFTRLMYFIMPGSPDDPASLPQHLALFHSSFNLLNSALLIGFVPLLEKLVTRMVRGGEERTGEFSSVTGSSALPQVGELNLIATEREVRQLAGIAREMFTGFQEIYTQPDEDLSERIRQLKSLEEKSDQMAGDITHHLITCSGDQLSKTGAKEVASLLRVVSELESICDCCFRLVKLTDKRYRKHRALPPDVEGGLNEFSTWVLHFIDFCCEVLGSSTSGWQLSRGEELEEHIDRSRKALRRQAMTRMRTSSRIEAEMLFVDLVNNMERIGNHCLNTLQALKRPESYAAGDPGRDGFFR